nr:unnamed protein product [Spirometra erinaceieuropaei]
MTRWLGWCSKAAPGAAYKAPVSPDGADITGERVAVPPTLVTFTAGEGASRRSHGKRETSPHRRAQTAERDSRMQRQLISPSDYEIFIAAIPVGPVEVGSGAASFVSRRVIASIIEDDLRIRPFSMDAGCEVTVIQPLYFHVQKRQTVSYCLFAADPHCPGSDIGFQLYDIVQKRFGDSCTFTASMSYNLWDKTQLLMRTAANPNVHQCFYVNRVREAKYYKMACNLTFSSVEFEIHHMAPWGLLRLYMPKDSIYVYLQNVVALTEVHYVYGSEHARGTVRSTGLQFTSLTDVKSLQDTMEALHVMNMWRQSALSILEDLAVQAFLNTPTVSCIL